AAIDGVFPGGIGFDEGNRPGVLEDRNVWYRGWGGIHRDLGHVARRGAWIAGEVELADLDDAYAIDSRRECEARAGPRGPVGASIRAVSPGRTGLQPADIDGAVVGDAVAAVTAGVLGQGDGRRRRGGVVHADARRGPWRGRRGA